MKKVAIMTDSVASVPCELAEKYDIQVIPFYVIIDGKSYLDTDIDKDELYTRLKQKENLPTASAPSPGDFLLAYQKLSQKAESIIHISMTAAFTKEYGAAIGLRDWLGKNYLKRLSKSLTPRQLRLPSYSLCYKQQKQQHRARNSMR